MEEYVKIPAVFQRDLEGTKKLMPGVYINETVDYLKNNLWIWTEKVDGTNIRVHWDGHKVEFAGRKEGSQIPGKLVNVLNDLFGGEANEQLFEQTFGDRDVILFGEGYGESILNGEDYMNDGKGVDFILFDLMIGGNYQPRESVHRCARTFGIDVVPEIGEGTLEQAVNYVKGRPVSKLGKKTKWMEGLVCRPLFELNDRCGNRVIVKVKWEDLKNVGG